jgi:hypothetical protein
MDNVAAFLLFTNEALVKSYLRNFITTFSRRIL